MNYFFSILFLFLSLNSFGQEIFIVVYKGDVFFDGDNKDKLLFKTKYEIPPKTNINYNANASFIVFSRSKYFYTPKSSNKILHADIKENLNKNAPDGFLKLMKTYNTIRHIESDAKGSSIAAAKGLNNKKDTETLQSENIIFPIDSGRISVNTIELKWKINNSVMGGKLMVIHKQSQDTIYNQTANSEGRAAINVEKPGTYDWFIYSKMGKKKRINQTFIKQTQGEAKKTMEEFQEFKKQLAQANEELKSILIEEYKLKNGIVE